MPLNMGSPSTMVQTISVAELSAAQKNLGVVQEPVILRQGTQSSPPMRLSVIGSLADQEELRAVNERIVKVDPIVCRFVRDVTVSGSGYMFHGSSLVTDGSHLSDVAVEWVGRPMPDSPVAAAPATERWLDGVAVIGIAPGHLIYGHWLIDLIPRFMIAKDVLGPEFRNAMLVLPDDTPAWALAMLEAFTGATLAQYAFYKRGIERLAVREACIPSYAHTAYSFHSYANEVFSTLGVAPVAVRGTRKLCISRVAFEGATHGVQKLFHTRERFEALAGDFGYEIVQPEMMGIQEQAMLFSSASHVVGEYGSALHSTVFGPAGLKIGYIRCPNQIQLSISALRRQPTVVVIPANDWVAPSGVLEYSLTDAEMMALFEANET